jgi:hypothetical protein
MSALNLFQGIAVLIDDELEVSGSSIGLIKAQIQAAGGYVVGLTELPAKTTNLANFAGASFFLLDWNLWSAQVGVTEGSGVTIPHALKAQHIADARAFLSRLRLNRCVPVFVFTNENLDAVRAELAKDPELFEPDQPSHILVKSKQEVVEKGVMAVLHEWVQTIPSAFVLKRWEVEYDQAKNQLFADFYRSSVYWPAVLWQTFQQDGVPASDELGRLIGRNLFSRMSPFQMDMTQFAGELAAYSQANPERYRADLMRVLEGERFVPSDRLHGDSINFGDLFKKSGKYYVNVRPTCDCVPRAGNADPALYLLKGEALGPSALNGKLDRDRGLLKERDDEAAVFAVDGGKTIVFKLKELQQLPWSELKAQRVGRLLPPFATRIQQRYAAYLQRPGIPRIPFAAMPPLPEAASSPPQSAAPATAGKSPAVAGESVSEAPVTVAQNPPDQPTTPVPVTVAEESDHAKPLPASEGSAAAENVGGQAQGTPPAAAAGGDHGPNP